MDLFCRSLLEHAYPLELSNSSLYGEGAELITTACRNSQVVMVGEDHGTAEIPAFVQALGTSCLEPDVLSCLAIETGHVTATFLADVVAAAHPMAEMSQAIQKFGRFVPFYDSVEELELLSEWVGRGSKIVGIDHEFLYAAGMLMEALKAEVLAVLPTEYLCWSEKHIQLPSASDGDNVSGAFLLRFNIEALMSLYDVAVRASAYASRIAVEVIRSYLVYSTYLSDQTRKAAEIRTKILCEALSDSMSPGGICEGASCTLIKVGYNHGFREMNLEGAADLGSYVEQLGCRLGFGSLHILVLGIRGTKLKVSGQSTAPHIEEFSLATDDRGHFVALTPILGLRDLEGAKVFDFRAIRKLPNYQTALTKEEQHLVRGYDLLVLFPTVSAAQAVL